MRAVRIHDPGGPEAMRLEEIPTPEPGPGEVRIRVAAAGVNFIDVYHRSGFYPLPSLPAGLGREGSGTVEAVGAGVDGFVEGDRVAFVDAPGAYADEVLLPAARAVPVPDTVELETAAACLLQGMTAHYLLHTLGRVTTGDRVLVHAAAGGVGLLAVQMAKAAGAYVVGACGSEEKAARARQAGADACVLTGGDWVAAVLAATDGRGVDLALDGVGRATFEGSVRATRVRGQIVLFGQASGEPEPIRPRRLLGSRTLSCASLFDYVRERAELLERAAAVFDAIAAGRLAIHVDRRFPLAEAADAHRRLEGRQSSGKILLVP